MPIKIELPKASVFALSTILMLLCACQPQPSSPAQANNKPVSAALSIAGNNNIQMLVNGKKWHADAEIFGAINPLGVANSILISGSFGPNNASEQDFTMSLTSASAPGRYRIKNGKPTGSVIQIGNLSQAQYLIGGVMFEQDIEVELLQVQITPLRLAGRFSGWMQANDGSKVQIRDGEFFYQE